MTRKRGTVFEGLPLARTLVAVSGAVAALIAAGSAQAGAGWGETSNITPTGTTMVSDGLGGLVSAPVSQNGLVRTYYANSPQGMQVNALTGVQDRDTGKALAKFVDALPGLAAPHARAVGETYIPVAIADTSTYSVATGYADADYYEIAVVEYEQRMHRDLSKATLLRGYVQIDPIATDTAGANASPGSMAVPLMQVQVDVATGVQKPVMISRPDGKGGFVQKAAYGFDQPSYLGPTIVATHGKPTRVKFYNALPSGHGAWVTDPNDPTGVAKIWQRNGDLFVPVDHTLFGGGEGQTQVGFQDLLCGDTLQGPNNSPVTGQSSCLGGIGPDGLPLAAGYVRVPKFELYTENREELHLHGGDNPWISDGTPHQWITPAADELDTTRAANYRRGDGAINVPDMPDPGPGAVTYYWPNGQSGRLMFYHDHATGLTRLNVYAGTAAGYLLTDPTEQALNSYAPGGQIPLVIQEKTFVPDDIATQDAKWDQVHWGKPGDLWFPHVYETNQDPLSADATNPVGRWDGASFFWPVFPQNYATPSGEYGNVSTTPESFMDTPIVNGMAYPTVTVNPQAYRFRILGVANDRMLNLSLFVADSSVTSASGVLNTEVKMVPFASPNSPTSSTYTCPDGSAGLAVGDKTANGTVVRVGWTEAGPNSAGVVRFLTSFPCAGGPNDTGWGQADMRPGGVPDTGVGYDTVAGAIVDNSLLGPDIIRIGNEGGLLPQAVVLPPSPVNYEYNKRSVTVLNVFEHGLWLGPAERADVLVDFSQYAGKTLILYNDSGAPVPAGDPRIDYYTDDGDQTAAGGAPNTVAGYGPNTRTIMQINVANGTPDPALVVANLNTAVSTAYVKTQPVPVVPTVEYVDTKTALATAQAAAGVPVDTGSLTTVGATAAPYERIYTGSIYLNQYRALSIPAATDEFLYTPAPSCTTKATCDSVLAGIRAGGLVQSVIGQPVSAFVESKAIQELFEADYGRMNATLGVELPFTNVNVQTTIPLAYVDPATETINPGEVQFWKITHNGVDSHPVHFHFINVQVLNRIGWDGTVKPPYADELGWKETVKMHPLEDIVVAVRAKTAPATPFGMPHSYRQPAPNQLSTDNHGITQIDAVTGQAPATPYTNDLVDYGSEYVWHCHILGHEENDFMRPFVFDAGETQSAAPTGLAATAVVNAGVTTGVALSWTDPSTDDGTTYDPIASPSGFLGNPANEIGFRVERAPVVAGRVGAYVPVAAGLHTYAARTPLVVNVRANGTTYTDSTTTSDMVATPGAPTLVGWTANAAPATDYSVTLRLPALPANASSYSVFRSDNPATALATGVLAGNWIDAHVPAATDLGYTLVAVSTAGPTYRYRVYAVTAAGDSPAATTANVSGAPLANSAASAALAVKIDVPAQPGCCTVTNGTANSANVAWTPAGGSATSYSLQYSTDSTFAAGVTTVNNLTVTNRTLNGLAANTTYFAHAQATNASGVSGYGAAGSFTTAPATPAAPTATANTTTGAIRLQYAAPAANPAFTYTLYQQVSTDGGATYGAAAPIKTGVAGSSLTLTAADGILLGNYYQFYLVANGPQFSSTAGASSAPVMADFRPATPAATSNPDGSIAVAFAAPPAGVTYTVYRQVRRANRWTPSTLLASGVTTAGYLDTRTSLWTTYRYALVAVSRTYTTPVGTMSGAVTSAPAAPAPVAAAAAAGTYPAVTLTYATLPGQLYAVYQNGVAAALATGQSTGTFTVNNLNATTNYGYYLRVVSVNGTALTAAQQALTQGPTVNVTTNAFTAPALTATAGTTGSLPSIGLSYVAAPGQSYSIYRSGGGGTLIASQQTSGSYNVANLAFNTTYSYYLMVEKANPASTPAVVVGNSQGATGTATTMAIPVPTNLAFVSTVRTATAASMTFSWTATAPVPNNNYQLQVSTSPTFANGNTTVTCATTTCTANVARNTNYYARVRAQFSGGQNGVYSAGIGPNLSAP